MKVLFLFHDAYMPKKILAFFLITMSLLYILCFILASFFFVTIYF